MRIGIHFHVPAISKADGIFMPGYFGCFIESLALYCDQVICFLHSPRADETGLMDYKINANNVFLENIGPHSSVIMREIHSKSFTSLLRKKTLNLDVLLLRGASPLLPAMAAASPVPTVLLLVSDYLTGVNDLPQPRWRKELIRLWCYWNKRGQERAIRHSLTFVNSRMLYNELVGKAPYLEETRTTTLSERDFFIREDTCLASPVHLLFTGRISVSKGIFDIFAAMKQLLAQKEDLILDIVGWPEKGEEKILDELFDFAQRNGFRDRVFYHGYKTVGPELFAYYKLADIFVLASRSEGFPRTIMEAMAHSLPVVATRVGSIPAFIKGSAELIAPRDVNELVGSIARLLHQPELRRHFIQRGLELARENTLEKQVGEMVTKIQAWLETQNG